jgi:nicotinamidase-related amidase
VAYGDEFYRIGTWREYVKEIPWPVGADFRLEPVKTALVVVDMTLSQCDKDAPSGVAQRLHQAGGKAAEYYFDTMSRVVPAIRSLVELFRNNRLQIVFLTMGPYLPDGGELPYFVRSMNRGSLQAAGLTEFRGTHQFKMIPELEPHEGDLVLHKLTASGFVGTSLDGILRNLGIQTVVLTGAATHACVEATARSAADLGYKIVLVEDACLDQSPLWHEVTMMNCIHFNWGKVLNSEQVLSELASVNPVSLGSRR